MDRTSAREFFRDVIVMAPMATGGNLPYRRLCTELGASTTCSEMVLSQKMVKGGEGPLLRHHACERRFGVQLAGKHPDVLAEAAALAVSAGAVYIDLNFGCPIDLVVRRGAGAALLKRPGRLAALVEAVRVAVEVPLSVKLRLGYNEKKLNAPDLARRCEEAGADAVAVHGRTRAQRYRLSARWDLIDEVAASVSIPVLGNGDLLTPWDLEQRRRETRVRSFLVARGALIKPWIFRELAEGRPWYPTTDERWGLLRRYALFALEHFGDDAKGRERARRFFLWHCRFWHRYHPWTEDDHRRVRPESLLQTRNPGISADEAAADPDRALLASADETDHESIWTRVLDTIDRGA